MSAAGPPAAVVPAHAEVSEAAVAALDGRKHLEELTPEEQDQVDGDIALETHYD